MYQPPPGRPISSPPSTEHINGSAPAKRQYRRWDEATKAKIKADYLAGVPSPELCARYDLGRGGLANILISQGIVRRPAALGKPRKPIRQAGESKNAYANRVKAWMHQNDPEWAAAWKAKMTAGVRKSWRKRKAAKARAEQAAAVPPMPPMPPTVPTPPVVFSAPPTLWQRIVGWFR
jgi:hypothetical protein